jgi:hypothetical protein
VLQQDVPSMPLSYPSQYITFGHPPYSCGDTKQEPDK